jgi:ABC-type nitrate/sulfonate/bicarbonate transport system substrate-binding protein
MEGWNNGNGVLNTKRFAMRDGFDGLKRRASTFIAVVVVGFLLSVSPPTKEVRAEPLRVGVVPAPHCAVIYLADSQGFFNKHGVDVVIKEYGTGPMAVNDLAAGNVDVAIAAESVFVLQAFRYPDLRILATICAGSDVELIVRKDRGIATPQDLKGKRVTFTRGSSGEFFLYNYLLFNRIPGASIQVVYHTPTEMVKAMADGTVDAALSWPPFATQMEKQLGAKVARWPAQGGQDYYITLLAKQAFLKKQPKTMEQFLAALLEAEQFIKRYPDRAQTALTQKLKLDDKSFLETWSRTRFQLQLTQDLLVLMEQEAKWAIRNRLVEKKEVPNYLDFFYFQALEKVKPEAVSIVH